MSKILAKMISDLRVDMDVKLQRFTPTLFSPTKRKDPLNIIKMEKGVLLEKLKKNKIIASSDIKKGSPNPLALVSMAAGATTASVNHDLDPSRAPDTLKSKLHCWPRNNHLKQTKKSVTARKLSTKSSSRSLESIRILAPN